MQVQDDLLTSKTRQEVFYLHKQYESYSNLILVYETRRAPIYRWEHFYSTCGKTSKYEIRYPPYWISE